MIFETLRDAEAVGGPIVRLFRTGLGRVPDSNALRTFVPMLRRGGSPRDVAQAIVASSEFAHRHGAGEADRIYLASLCRDAFGREATAYDLEQQFGATGAGAGRVDLLLSVAESDEARNSIGLESTLFPQGLPPRSGLAYELWLDRHPDADAIDADEVAAHLTRLASRPVVSLVLTVGSDRPDLLFETAESVREQDYPEWQLCLVRPPGLPAAVAAAVAHLAARPGISLCESAEGAAAGLAAATGTFVGFLEPGDRLARCALHALVAELEAAPDAVLLFSDEDLADGGGRRWAPRLKTGWNPDLLLAGDAVGQLALLRADRVREVGGLRPEAAPFGRYDLVLRATEGLAPSRIRHVPAVLFHGSRRRGALPGFPEACSTSEHPVLRDIVLHRLEGSGITLAEELRPSGRWPRLRFPLPDPAPLVSVIVPVRDRAELLRTCVDGLLTGTGYDRIEVLVLDNGSTEPATGQLLRRLDQEARVRVVRAPGPFNWSALNNLGAREARGDVLLLLNNDVEMIEPDWLAELVSHAVRPEVGAVGARLLYPWGDRPLQHGGIMFDAAGEVTHLMRFTTADRDGYLAQVATTRDLSAVTGACLAIRRSVFAEAGGLDERLTVAWSDVDLCLRLRARGYRVVWTPWATLLHHECATRGADETPERTARLMTEKAHVRRNWEQVLLADPYRNPALQAPEHGDLTLAEPPPPPLLRLRWPVAHERGARERRGRPSATARR